MPKTPERGNLGKGSGPTGRKPTDRRPPGRKPAVGYGRPPVEHQFKPGNKLAKGRPKGRKNEATIIKDILNRMITVVRNGKPVRMTNAEAMWWKQFERALQGDSKAALLLSDRYHKAEDDISQSTELTPDDRAVFEASIEKLLKDRKKDEEE